MTNLQNSKNPIILFLFLTAGLFALLLSGCVNEHHIVIIINQDASCTVVSDTTIQKEYLKQIIEYDNLPSHLNSTSEKPRADKDKLLVQQVKALIQKAKEKKSGDISVDIKNIEIINNKVRIQMVTKYTSINDFIRETEVFDPFGFEHIEVSYVKEDEMQLKILRDKTHYALSSNQYLQYLKTLRFKGGFRLIMPGEIVSSPFKNIDNKATWITFDTSDEKSMDTMRSTSKSESLIFISKKKGFNVKLPLSSRELKAVQKKQESPFVSIPLKPAEDGYITKATSVTTTRVIDFPQNNNIEQYLVMDTQEKIVVRVQIFTPPGRYLYSLENVSKIKAWDDGANKIIAKENPVNDYLNSRVNSGLKVKTDFELYLNLPQSNTKTISKVTGETEVISFKNYKELHLNKPIAENQHYDISPLIPGATLKIIKIEKQADNSIQLQLQITGPRTVQITEVKFNSPQDDYAKVEKDIGSNKHNQGKNIVTLTIYHQDNSANSVLRDKQLNLNDMTLIIRKPVGLKHELVKFTLLNVPLY